MNMCHDSADTAVSGDQYSLQRLQVEVDQFFLRAAYQIISAHRYTVHEGSSFQYVLHKGRTCPSVLFRVPFSILSSFPVFFFFYHLCEYLYHNRIAKCA